MRELQGSRTAAECRFGLVAARFNEAVTEGLLRGALDALGEAGVNDDQLTLVRVPGSFEIPVAALRLAETGLVDAVICLGCLIKGDTMHFEFIAGSSCQAIADVAVATGVPMALGVLTTLTEEQALARAAAVPENKGREAALAAIEMATLFRRLPDDLTG
jgi:6,7-dimethyl-8-ribityllumazine synthase